MRWTLALPLLALAACAGPDSDPVKVAEEFHENRVEADDREMYALLTEADRAAVPFESFPGKLPTPVMLNMLGFDDAPLDSANLVDTVEDTAHVALFMANGEQDTLQLVATREPREILWVIPAERVTWRVSMRLAELARIDSLATFIRTEARATDSTAVAAAEAYLRGAQQHPALGRPADIDAARGLLRAAEVANALQIEVRRATANSGVPFIQGQIENPTDERINTISLVVRDATGAEEEFELWDIPPGGSTPIWRITRLERPPLTYRIQQIRVF